MGGDCCSLTSIVFSPSGAEDGDGNFGGAVGTGRPGEADFVAAVLLEGGDEGEVLKVETLVPL